MNKETWTKQDQAIFEIIDRGLKYLRQSKHIDWRSYQAILNLIEEEQ